MPLVSQNVIAAWYRKDAWTYRNLAFIYRNPLWQKPVPQGFSLCPLFWSALFSLFILRPMIYLFIGLRAILRHLGLGKLVKATDRLAERIGLNSGPLGFATFKMAMVALAGACVIYFPCSVLKIAYDQYRETDFLYALFAPIALLIGFAVTLVYVDGKKDPNRCRVEYYLYGACVLAVAGAFIWYRDYAFYGFFTMPADVFMWLIHGIAWSATEIWRSFVYFFSWHGTFRLSWWFALALLTVCVYGWLDYRFRRYEAEPVQCRRSPKEINARMEAMAEQLRYKLGLNHSVAYYLRYARQIEAAWIWARNGDGLTTSEIDVVAGQIEILLATEAVKKATRNVACRRATEMFARLFSPLIWALKQFKLFVALIGALWKAKKQGICPFYRFEE